MADGLSTPAPVESAHRHTNAAEGWHAQTNGMGVVSVASQTDPKVRRRRPRLLVSVRSADEAAIALNGGADIIDIKEPQRGPLGMADLEVIAQIVARIADQSPVSVALGEALDWPCRVGSTGLVTLAGATGFAGAFPVLPAGLTFTKLGLAGFAKRTDWITDWLRIREQFETAADRPLAWVAVAYADATAADSPPVAEVIEAAASTGCHGVLIDTYDKTGDGVLELPAKHDLDFWRQRIQAAGMFGAVAGRLRAPDLSSRRLRRFDIIGVRSAACLAAERSQQISCERVQHLRRRLRQPPAKHSMAERDAANDIRARWPRRPAAAIILGTGMGRLADSLDIECSLDVRDVPRFRPTTAPGHRGRILCGLWHGVPVIALDGRCHRYEGCTNRRVAFPVHVMRKLGARVLIATNAAGGLNPAFRIGDVMVLNDHIDLMGGDGFSLMVERSSTRSAGGDATQGNVYDRRLVDIARNAARDAGFTAHAGTYVGVTGPNYETRAEYRLFRAIGGDAVGMSTIPELRAARAAGMRTLALSVITNVANPDALEPADANSVIEAAESAVAKVHAIIDTLMAQLPKR